MGVVKHINIDNLVPEFESQLIKNVTLYVKEQAQNRVRVDQGTLKGSIRVMGNVVYSSLPYARAQEYGLRAFGKPKYKYTPYMRPAAKSAERAMSELSRKSMREVIRKV